VSHPQAARAIRAFFVVALIGAFAVHVEAPRPVSAAATLVSMSASGSATGGKRVHIRVVISEPAPVGGLDIPLSSNNPAVPVPSHAHVNSGATEELVGVTTRPVVDTVIVTVTASYKGVVKSRPITIKEPIHSSLSLQSVIRAGGQGRVTVRLSGRAPVGGITVQLSTDRSDKFALPTSVTVLEGAASAILKVNATDQVPDVPISVTSHYQKGSINNTYTKNAIIRHFTATPTPTATNPTDVPSITPTWTMTPTATATPDPNNPTFSFTVKSGDPVVSGGSVVLTVCMLTGPNPPYTITFISTSQQRAMVTAGSPHTYAALNECTDVTLTDLPYPTSGNVRLRARLSPSNVTVGESANINFPGEPLTATPTSTTAAAQSANQPAQPTSTPVPTEPSEPILLLSPEGTP
jgi:hypothetical protein